MFKLGLYSLYHISRPRSDVTKYLDNIHLPHRNLIIDKLSEVDDLSNYTIVEFGCGWGPNLKLISDRLKSKCVGFDISKSSIEIARSKNSNVKFEVLNMKSSHVQSKLEEIETKVIVITDASLMYLSKNEVQEFFLILKKAAVRFMICVELVGDGSKEKDGYFHDYEKIFSDMNFIVKDSIKLNQNFKDAINWQKAGFLYFLRL